MLPFLKHSASETLLVGYEAVWRTDQNCGADGTCSVKSWISLQTHGKETAVFTHHHFWEQMFCSLILQEIFGYVLCFFRNSMPMC